MGKPPRRFGAEFEAEAVRLVETSGRAQRDIADHLGIGLSTLRRWLEKRRERDLEVPPPERQEEQAGPSPCGALPPGWFTPPTGAANNAPSTTRLN